MDWNEIANDMTRLHGRLRQMQTRSNDSNQSHFCGAFALLLEVLCNVVDGERWPENFHAMVREHSAPWEVQRDELTRKRGE